MTNQAKEAAGNAAAHLVETGMAVGLGTGSTAHFFIRELGQMCRNGLRIKALASSEASRALAEKEGIPLLDASAVTSLDLTADGADQVDSRFRLIKGGGGALLREKIMAEMSKRYVIIVDEGKLVNHFNGFPLPVEIVPFGCKAAEGKLKAMGYKGNWRSAAGAPYVTDNGNYIYDIAFPGPIEDPEEEHARIRSVTGIVETGFFFTPIERLIVGKSNGTVEEKQAAP